MLGKYYYPHSIKGITFLNELVIDQVVVLLNDYLYQWQNHGFDPSIHVDGVIDVIEEKWIDSHEVPTCNRRNSSVSRFYYK